MHARVASSDAVADATPSFDVCTASDIFMLLVALLLVSVLLLVDSRFK